MTRMKYWITIEYKELSDSELEWKLSVAAAVADLGGVHLLPYRYVSL